MATLHEESLFIPLINSPTTSELHLRYFAGEEAGNPVLMLHGSVENGRIFYSRTQKGLAPYLAQAGYQVYVLDFRGRGESRPSIREAHDFGQWEAIMEDIPAALQAVADRHPQQGIHLMAHSWGGVLATCTLARLPEWAMQIESLTYWGSKRRAAVKTGEVRLKIRFFWEKAAFGLTSLYGYLPAKRFRIGADDETKQSHAESAVWTRPKAPFVDPQDGFHYGDVLRQLSLPRGLYLVGAKDLGLGHLDDVKRLRDESHHHNSQLHILGIEQGHQHDYGHIDMLTHRDAAQDHFPLVLDFLRGQLTI